MNPVRIGTKQSRYWIVDKLGEGGMGVVYKAYDQQLQRTVAIKFLKWPPTNERSLQVLESEARATSALNHANIVTVYDIDPSGDEPFLIFEFIEGETLAAVPAGGWKTDLVVRYGLQMADALSAASRVGIVHRDLKPTNVMIARSGEVKILDFGLAGLPSVDHRHPVPSTIPVVDGDDPTLIVKSTDSSPHWIAGTPGYMAPEQARGQTVDLRADIYSFGALIVWMATGTPLAREREDSGRHRLENLPRELRPIAKKCLESDPADRYQSFGDLHRALSALAPQNRRGEHTGFRKVLFAGLAIVCLTFAGFLSQRSTGSPSIPDRPNPLTSYSGKQEGASFSPDARTFAFAWDGGEGANLDIYTQSVGGTSNRRLTFGPTRNYNPAYSPDGRWIAFLRAIPPTHAQLLVTPSSPTKGVTERLLANLQAAPYLETTALDWSPDGKWILYGDVDKRDKKSIWAVSFATGEKRAVASPGADEGYFTQPAVSRKGDRIAFVEDFYGASRIRLGRLDLRNMKLSEPSVALRLRGLESFDPAGPRWVGNTPALVFTADGGGFGRALWYADIGSGSNDVKPRQIQSVSGFFSHPEVSRDGSLIAVTQRIEDRNVWRIALGSPNGNGPVPLKLLGSVRQEQNAAYSPDGSRIAFASDRTGLPNIWVADADGRNSYPITDLHGSLNASPRWNRDGSRVVFETSDGGHPAIYMAAVRRGAPLVRVAASGVSHVEPCFCNEDKSVYYVDNSRAILEIWRSPLSGEKPERVLPSDNYLPTCSSDGRSLYYLAPSASGTAATIMGKILPNGTERVVASEVSPQGFALSARRVFFERVRSGSRAFDIFSKSLDNGGEERMEAHVKGKASGLSVTPDGKFALITRIDQDTSTLVVLRRD